MDIKNFLWMAPFISFAAGYLIMHQAFNQTYSTSPTLIGKPVHEILATVTQHNLNIRLIDQKEEPALPEGIILHQTPSAGSSIKSHQPIFIVTSKKPETSQAPACVGMDLDSLSQELLDKKIQAHIHYLPHAYPEKTCFAQHPCAGELLEKNNLILYVSSGNNKPIIWPELRKLPYEEVCTFLDNYNINPQIISNLPFAYSDEDLIIIDQRPFAGTLLTIDENKPLSVQLRINPRNGIN